MIGEGLYRLFKYAIYALLTFNIALFFSEEWAAAPHRFAGELATADIVVAFAQTIDTAAWVVLLLMFELETYVLVNRRLAPAVSISLHGLRAICYGFILYAFYGYLSKLALLLGATSAAGVESLCSLASQHWIYVTGLDEFTAITGSNCATLSAETTFFQWAETRLVVDETGKFAIARLAWLDVINSAAWILVVAILEIEIRLRDRGLFVGNLQRLSNVGKILLYSVLLFAAVYWGVKGEFVDFWDAFLWLLAFYFIEMNVIAWQRLPKTQTPASSPLRYG